MDQNPDYDARLEEIVVGEDPDYDPEIAQCADESAMLKDRNLKYYEELCAKAAGLSGEIHSLLVDNMPDEDAKYSDTEVMLSDITNMEIVYRHLRCVQTTLMGVPKDYPHITLLRGKYYQNSGINEG